MITKKLSICLVGIFCLASTVQADGTDKITGIISDFVQNSVQMATTLSQAVTAGQKCQLETTQGEILRILVRANQVNTYGFADADVRQKSFFQELQQNPSISSAMNGYLGYEFFINQMQLNNASNLPPLDKLGQAFVGDTFEYSGESNYSAFDELKFKAGGVLAATTENQKTGQEIPVTGTWSLSSGKTSQFAAPSVIVTLTAGTVTERLELTYDVFPYNDSMRLTKIGAKFNDESGFANEVRFCAQ